MVLVCPPADGRDGLGALDDHDGRIRLHQQTVQLRQPQQQLPQRHHQHLVNCRVILKNFVLKTCCPQDKTNNNWGELCRYRTVKPLTRIWRKDKVSNVLATKHFNNIKTNSQMLMK